jgi:hypothetical protein
LRRGGTIEGPGCSASLSAGEVGAAAAIAVNRSRRFGDRHCSESL